MKLHKSFDLEAAKRGEPVEFYSEIGDWLPIHFVGASRHGLPVLQLGGEFHPRAYADTTTLRMAAKKVTVRYRVAVLNAIGSGLLYLETVSNGAEAEDMSNRPDFIQWADSWREVEIPQ